MLRRDPETILTAHRMDRGRRELYVEGGSDKAFIEWVVGDRMAVNASVITVDSVEVPQQEDGNRGRLVEFLSIVDGAGADIQGLVDADLDRLVQARSLPRCAWLTDGRDLEGYVMTEESFDAVLRAGFGISAPPASAVFQSMVSAARYISALRTVSAERSLRLPVSRGAWDRYVACTKGVDLRVDRDAILRSLMQTAGVSLRDLEQLRAAVEIVESNYRELPPPDVVHGKDGARVFRRQLASLGVAVPDGGPVLRSTFPRHRLHEFPVLSAIVEYLSGA